MKFTYNWLKDFVEIKITPQALAEKLTMSGLEITSLQAREGDFVFEAEITANRPDCLSVSGIAREVAAITGKKIKWVRSQESGVRSKGPLVIRIEDKKDCPLYIARIIKKVKVGPSPAWLKKRLELVGCRSINNIVDITNYIQFNWGEPLHAFDLDKLSKGAIIVRRAKNGEKITTIDAEEKALNQDILVIADEKKPIAIAGVMGGKVTEVTEATKNILLEAAVFNPQVVRRSRRTLGIMSESAYRFERGVNLEIVEFASASASRLIEEYAKGRCALSARTGSAKTKKGVINLGAEAVNKFLGVNISGAKIKQILDSLGFKVKAKGKFNFIVTTLSYRQDVTGQIDLIEEIARIFGFENIPRSLPLVRPKATGARTKGLVSLIKNILVGLGLNEVITYSLIDKDLLEGFDLGQAASPIEILNPLSKEQAILRPTLIPSLSRCIAYNLNQKQEYVNIFEVAKVFTADKGAPKEELSLGIALSGSKPYLFEGGLVKDEAGPLHLKGILEALFEKLGIRDYKLATENNRQFPIYVGEQKIGLLLSLEKNALDKLDIKNKNVFLLELSLDKLFSYAQIKNKFVELAKYPGIARDISFILKVEVSVKEILEALKIKGGPLLSEIKIVDYYKGKQIPAGYRGLTVSCLYRSQERTLTEAEISPLHEQVRSVLTERFFAQIR